MRYRQGYNYTHEQARQIPVQKYEVENFLDLKNMKFKLRTKTEKFLYFASMPLKLCCAPEKPIARQSKPPMTSEMEEPTREELYTMVEGALPDLVGQKIKIDSGEVLIIESIVGRFVHAYPIGANDSGNGKRRVPYMQGIKGWFSFHLSKETVGTPTEIKRALAELAGRARDAKRELVATRNKLAKEKKRIRKIKKRTKRHLRDEKKKGDQLPVCRDTHTDTSLDNQFESANSRIESLEKDEHDLSYFLSGKLGTYDKIVAFCKDELNFKVSKASLSEYTNMLEIDDAKPGRPTLLGEGGEEVLARTVLFLDEMGVPMRRSVVIGLAQEMLQGDTEDTHDSRHLTKGWYQSWLRRMKKKFPQLVEVSCRDTDNRCLDWFNAENYSWWFNRFIHKLLELGFIERAGGAYKWITPERVMITDETCISGGQLRKKQSGRQKVLTSKENVEKSSKQRRVAAVDSYEEHITMMAGHTLDFELTPPWYIISSSAKQPKEETLEAVRQAAVKYPEFPKINGHKVTEPIVGWSPKGGVTRDNIRAMAMTMIKQVWPDVADEPGKRVLWLTDLHGSRLCVDLLSELKQTGIILIVWLPNCTSKMQSPDVAMFGPFKEKRDRIEREWTQKNPKKKVTRELKIKFAGQALVDACPSKVLRHGSKRTGLRPLDPNVLLSHSSIKDGDYTRKVFSSLSGTGFKQTLQETNPSPAISFEDHAKHVMQKLERQPPMLGTNRLIYDGMVSENEYADIIKETTSQTDKMISAIESYAGNATLFKAKLGKENEALQKQIDDLKKRMYNVDDEYSKYSNKLKQEAAHMKLWKDRVEKVESNPSEQDRKLLSIVKDRLELLSMADIDEFGLPITDVPVKRVRPTTPVADGISLKPLHAALTAASTGHRERHAKRLKQHSGIATPKKKFEGGSIMTQCSEIELTSEAVMTRVKEHESKKASAAEKKAKNKALREQKQVSHLINLKGKMRSAGKHIAELKRTNETREKVLSAMRLRECRPLVTCGKDFAKAVKDESLLKDCIEAAEMKSGNAKDKILSVYEKHISGSLSFLNR